MSLIAHQTAVFKGGACLRRPGFASPPCRQQVPRVGKISEGLLRAPQITPEDVQWESSSLESVRAPEQRWAGPPEGQVCAAHGTGAWRNQREKVSLSQTAQLKLCHRHSLYKPRFILVRKQSKQPFA